MSIKTKKDYQDKLFEILNPLLPHYSEGKARLTLGYTGALYDNATAEMEGFARVLWGLAPYFSGGGQNDTFEKNYLQGLTNGTNPRNPEYWGDLKNNDQRFAEIGGIATGLLLAPNKLWAPLSSEAKSNLASWISSVNKLEAPPNNFQFFGVLVNVALKKLGCSEFSQVALDKFLSTINSYYEGNGWYRDGALQTHDYYNAFALHYYGLLYSVFMAKEDPVNSQLFKERAMLFGPQFVYWFDETGPAVPYGRSLTYRFAEVAFFSACIFAGVEPIGIEVMKGIINRNLNGWWQSHMLDFSGILTIGYEYPNLIMAENYNAPGSPLWALKAFLLLALDDSHPFWTVEAAPYPKVQNIKMLPEAEMLLMHRNKNTLLFPAGTYSAPFIQGHIEEKYAKFAYSSKFGFSVHKANDCLENMAPDSDLVFEIDGLFFGRTRAKKAEVSEKGIVSNWSPCKGIEVVTELKVNYNSYSLQHVVISDVECVAYSCGFAISRDAVNYNAGVTNDCATIISNGVGCEVSGGPGIIINAAPNTNLLYPRTAIPAIKHTVGVGTTKISAYITIFP